MRIKAPRGHNCKPWRRGAYLGSMKTRSNAKAKAQSNAHKAFSNYLATRRACQRHQATIQQVAKALALFDLTLAIANLPTRKPGASK